MLNCNPPFIILWLMSLLSRYFMQGFCVKPNDITRTLNYTILLSNVKPTLEQGPRAKAGKQFYRRERRALKGTQNDFERSPLANSALDANFSSVCFDN